ncbi:MAG TPA: hypothetical protein PK031_06910, partial [Pseudomonadales bacterium]|nr:hypothetical protein [Pseudomonadales bacterium]
EDPKLGDVIASHVYSEIQSPWGSYLENDWGLDPKNFVFADERRPLDIYRSILKITDERSPVFSILGGSTTVLTPMGNKAPALGILMAAIEKEFPIVYVESISYSIDLNGLHDMEDWNCSDKIAHVWLCGDAYLTQAESTS